jgi:hypothetical protein
MNLPKMWPSLLRNVPSLPLESATGDCPKLHEASLLADRASPFMSDAISRGKVTTRRTKAEVVEEQTKRAWVGKRGLGQLLNFVAHGGVDQGEWR